VAKKCLDDNIFYSPCKFDANRYIARSLSFDIVEIKDSFNNTKMFSDFVKIVNGQSNYNQGGKINAIPLIIFHNLDLTEKLR